MKAVDIIALILIIIGAINWGLIGFFNFNLVEALFSTGSPLTNIIYAIVGICGLINIGLLFTRFSENEK